MAATQHELDEHLKTVRKQLKQSNLEYITVAGIEVSDVGVSYVLTRIAYNSYMTALDRTATKTSSSRRLGEDLFVRFRLQWCCNRVPGLILSWLSAGRSTWRDITPHSS